MAETRKSPSAKTKAEKPSVGLEKRKEELLKATVKKRHTVSIVMFAVGLFLIALSFIGNSFAEKMSAWDHLHAFLYGLFGLTVFFVGPLVIYIAVMISADMTRSTVAKRLFQLILLLLLLSAAMQVIFVGSIGDPAAPDAGFGDKIGYVYEKGKSLSGGGVFGVVLGFPLLLFGQIGAIIILALVTFVTVMIITDKSLPDLFNAVKKPAKKIKDHHDRVAEERGVIAEDLKQLEEDRLRQRREQREIRSAERQARREENELNAEQRRRSKFDSIASVTTGAQQEVSEQDRQEAAKIKSTKKDPVKEQKQESAEFQKDLKDYLNAKYGANKMDRPPAFPTESAPVEPYRPDEPKFADDSGDTIPEKHLNPVVKHDSLIDETHVPATRIYDSSESEKAPEAPVENEAQAPYSPVLKMPEDIPGAADDGMPETLAAAVDDDTPPWEDPKPAQNAESAKPAAESSNIEDNRPGDNAVYIGQPQINYGINADKKETDIIDAIKDFTKEQQERAAAAEENARVLGTVIKEDEHGQSYVSEVLSDGETYTLPPLELLNDVVHERSDDDINAEITHNAQKLVDTLKSFGVETRFLEAARGPSVTRYELQPAPGVKISKITGLVDDIALNLATAGVRIEAPIPNKAAVGIEVPNKKVESVPFREMVDTKEFRETKSKLGAVLGKSISGDIVIADIAKMPHILIAGTTGSGKSVCVNSIIMSILFRSTPDEVRLLMIDPKAVEFMIYNGIPHLLIPVVTDPKKASGALAWAVTEMLNRYKLFSDNNVRDLGGYNKLAKTREDIEPMPQIVIFIDELADLMMASPGEVEDSICRLAQMARAAGMHLVIATQRPSVNVVTGVIKANIPSRIALKVASQVDSRTIIDSAGAEKLLGKGDMLYAPVGMPKPMRVQGCWVSDGEVERVVDFIKNSFTLDYDQGVIDEIERQAELAAQKAEKGGKNRDAGDEDGGADMNDDKLDEAIEAVIEAGQASTSYLQRRLKLGYGRAARLIDTMEQLGVVGGFEGAKPRQVIMTKQEWYERKMNKSE